MEATGPEAAAVSGAGEETPEKACFKSSVDPRVLDLISWRDQKKSAVVLGAALLLLIALSNYSSILVFCELALLAVGLGLSYRLYRNLLQALKKEPHSNPFSEYLEMDVRLTAENTRPVVTALLAEFNGTVSALRRIILVESIVESLKYGVLLWVLTYVGSCFNGLTLLIVAIVLAFTVPKLYETYPEQIHKYYNLVTEQVTSTYNMVCSKVPFLNSKEKEQ